MKPRFVNKVNFYNQFLFENVKMNLIADMENIE